MLFWHGILNKMSYSYSLLKGINCLAGKVSFLSISLIFSLVGLLGTLWDFFPFWGSSLPFGVWCARSGKEMNYTTRVFFWWDQERNCRLGGLIRLELAHRVLCSLKPAWLGGPEQCRASAILCPPARLSWPGRGADRSLLIISPIRRISLCISLILIAYYIHYTRNIGNSVVWLDIFFLASHCVLFTLSQLLVCFFVASFSLLIGRATKERA